MADEIKIITNNQWRPILRGDELTDEEKKEFDYVDWNNYQAVIEQDFFRYKGEVYHLQDSETVPYPYSDSNFKEWDGLYSETFFSGILFKFDQEYENVRVGRYYS